MYNILTVIIVVYT